MKHRPPVKALIFSIFATTALASLALASPATESQEQVKIETLQKQVMDQANRLRALEREQQVVPNAMQKAGPGVGLIVGEYIWTDPTGNRPLRFQGFDQAGNPLRDAEGRDLAAFNGAGPIIVREFEATAFLVDAHHLVTSGYLLSPWRSDPLLDESENPEIVPYIRLLHAYFPGVKKPLDLEIDGATESGTVVLCNIKGTDVLKTPVSISETATAAVGEPIVMLGYPGGVQLLLSRLPDDLRRELYKFGQPGIDETAGFLAENGYVQPIAFQSRVSGQTEDRLFFETLDSFGSTGGPLINADGDVIGMSQSVHTQFPSFNMGVMISPLKPWIQRLSASAPK